MAEGIKLSQIVGRGVPVDGNDIDTDRIVPARYLKEITFANMGHYAFFDERVDENGNARPHPFNDPAFTGAAILIVNKNFGCGSSREHAPQAILRSGIKAVVGESSRKLRAMHCHGSADHRRRKVIAGLADAVRRDPQTSIQIDLSDRKISWAEMLYPSRCPICSRPLPRALGFHYLFWPTRHSPNGTAKLPYVRNFKLPVSAFQARSRIGPGIPEVNCILPGARTKVPMP